MTAIACDLAIVGGGLAGGLIALTARRARPERRIVLIEAAPSLGGSRLRVFADGGLHAEDKALLAPLVSYGWRGHGVAFPRFERSLPIPLYAIRPDRFDAALRAALPADDILTGRRAAAMGSAGVRLEDGTEIIAQGVVDARGAGDLSRLDLYWRKSVGYELSLEAPHGLSRAMLIERDPLQPDNLRYRTVLPIEPDRLFVEDVRYEAKADLDPADQARQIAERAARSGWRLRGSADGQAGIAPVALGGSFATYWGSSGHGVAKVGLRAALFHPVSGDTLGDALATARMIAEAPDWSGASLHTMLHAHAAACWAERDYYRRFAGRMLDRAAAAALRPPLEALYASDPALIGRFHAMTMRLTDRLALGLGERPRPWRAMVQS